MRTLRLAGLWHDWSSPWRVPYALYSAFVVFAHFYFSLSLLQFTKVLDDFQRAVVCAYLGSVGVAVTFKVVSFLVMRRSVDQLLALADPCLAANQASPLMQAASRHAKLVSAVLQTTTLIAIVGWIVSPVLFPVSGPNKLPFDEWYPFDVTVSPNYEMVYIFQAVSVCCCAVTLQSMDSFFVTFFIILAAQIAIINERLATIGEGDSPGLSSIDGEPLIQPPVSVDSRSTALWPYSSGIRQAGAYKDLVKTVQLHQDVIRSVKQLEKIVGPPLLVQFTFNLFAICLTAYAVVTDPDGSGSFGKFATSLVLHMGQNFIYCWYGDLITSQSERLHFSAYSCAWPDLGHRFRRSLHIVLMATRQPLRLQVGNMYTLSRETFLSLLRGSYSFFALLYNMNDN